MGSSWHLCGQEDILLSKVLAGRQEEHPATTQPPPPHLPLRLSGVSYIWGISQGEGDRSPITG